MTDKSLPLMLRRIASEHPNLDAQWYRDETKEFIPVTFSELYQHALDFAAGLMLQGVKRGSNIGIISDNRPEWLWANFGILSLGAADVPRGSDATVQDLKHILSVAECEIVILENKFQVEKVISIIQDLPSIKKIILFENFDFSAIQKDYADIEFLLFEEVLKSGKIARENKTVFPEAEMDKGCLDDMATVIFTSGTTGIPKGVMLSHRNFLAQIPPLHERLPFKHGDKCLSVLPVWHSFERECEYILVAVASTIIYSKPLASVLLPDFAKTNPHAFPSVPRVWEGVYDAIYKMMRKKGGLAYAIFRAAFAVGGVWKTQQLKLTGRMSKFKPSEKITHPLTAFLPVIFLYPLYLLFDLLVFRNIRTKFGKNFNAVGGVSGGGALPKNVDMFFSTAGVKILEGYGITETAPVVGVRPSQKAVFGNVGKPIEGLQVKIIDEEGKNLPCGVAGAVCVKGPTVMLGYYKDPQKTAEAIDSDKWFNTGDLGMLTIDGEIVLRGRLKDTIVLRGGENIEPVPIEMKLQESPYIKTAVVLGQDQRYLACLLVVDSDMLSTWAKENGYPYNSVEELVETPEVEKLYESEISSLISSQNGFKIFERISKFKLLTKEFEQGKEFSIKLEVARHRVNKIYEKEIAWLF